MKLPDQASSVVDHSGQQPNKGYYQAYLVASLALVGIIILARIHIIRLLLPALDSKEYITEISEQGGSPYYFPVAILLFITAILFFTKYNHQLFKVIDRLNSKSWVGYFIILVWILNSSRAYQNADFGIANDPLHEGEYVAYAESFRKDGLPGCFLIHGPAANILPAVVAGEYDPSNHSIAISRLVRSMLSLLGLAGFLWAVWETLDLYGAASRTNFLSSVLLVIACEGFLYLAKNEAALNHFRDAAFWFLIAILLRSQRLYRETAGKHLPRFSLGLLTGAFGLLQFAVCYERAINSMVVLSIWLPFQSYANRRVLWDYLGGMVLGGCLIVLMLGWDFYREIFRQIQYWAQNGDKIFSLTFNWRVLADHRMLILQLLSFAMVLFLVVRDFRWRSFSSRAELIVRAPVLFWLLVSLLSFRRFMGRCDEPHIGLAGLSATCLWISCILWQSKTRCCTSLPEFWTWLKQHQFGIVLGLLLLYPNCQPFTLVDYIYGWKINARMVDEKTIEVAKRIEEARNNAPAGSFYTFDSNGIWFHLLNTPSPSCFHQLIYALPTSAQIDLLRELNKNPPTIILVPPESSALDKIAYVKSFAPVYDYLYAHYELVSKIHDYSIYKLKKI